MENLPRALAIGIAKTEDAKAFIVFRPARQSEFAFGMRLLKPYGQWKFYDFQTNQTMAETPGSSEVREHNVLMHSYGAEYAEGYEADSKGRWECKRSPRLLSDGLYR